MPSRSILVALSTYWQAVSCGKNVPTTPNTIQDLKQEDWTLIPDLFVIAQRTMKVVKMNLSFTILYNLVGLSLAAFGILPPILAAAAQSLPDLGILANSSRLLRQKLPNLTGSSKAVSAPLEEER